MKFDIEVVGERCRRKDEPRFSRDPDVTIPEQAPSSFHTPHQPPGTPEHGLGGRTNARQKSGKSKRSSFSSLGCPSSASWRHMTYHGHGGSESRGVFEDKGVVSRAQTANVKVRISYVDHEGRVSASPKSSRGGRPVTIPGRDRRFEDLRHPGHSSHGLSGWGSSVSITNLVDSFYRPKTSVSTRDKICGSLLDKHFMENPLDLYHSQFTDAARSEEELMNMSSSVLSMPTIPSSRPNLTSSTPCTTPTSPLLQTNIPRESYTTDTAVINLNGDSSGTSRTTNSNPPTDKPHNILNGIHAKGKGPSSSAVMNGTYATRKGQLISAVMNGFYTDSKSTVLNGESVRSSSHGPVSRPGTILDKRVQLSVADSMKERLRNMYAHRRVQSAGVKGGCLGPSGSVAVAYSRLRGRRKTQAPQVAEVVRDEDGPPPVSRMFRKFRMVGFITITLIRLKAAIVVNSLDRTERSAAEIQWRTLYGQQEAEKLAFNKSHYSRERITTKMPSWALEIFDVRPEYRTEHDCRRLHALFRGMRSFDKFTEEIQLNLCRAFIYTSVEESRIVLRRGHVGHNFYFVYSGSVFVNVQDVDKENKPFVKTEAILARGDSFGELALLKDIKRTATVSVRESCELLVVDKDVFSQVCPKIFEKELMEKKSFISRMSLFSSKWWSAEALSSLCMEAQIQEYKINKIVVENSTTEDWLYICMEGKCQVISCLSGEKEEEGENLLRGREQSVILSDEIIELLSAGAADEDKEEEENENSKEMLLSSLGLEYVQTGKRSGAFLEEVEEEERRKAFLASAYPMTLTSLMARKMEEGKSGLVYVKVGHLESEDVFDLGSLIKAPAPRLHSGLLLVSCGARILRVKKSLFSRLASNQAMEHTRTMVSKHPFPSEATILESYKRKVNWNSYKAKVVKDLIRSRDVRSAPQFRYCRKTKAEGPETTSKERGQTPRRQTASSHQSSDDAKSSIATTENSSTTEKNEDAVNEADNLTTESNEERESNLKSSNVEHGEASTESKVAQVPRRIFPVVEVDIEIEPETPRPSSSSSSEDFGDLKTAPALIPIAMQYGVGPGPEAVIIRRRSSIGVSRGPMVSVDTTFVTRRRCSHGEASSGPVTRFNLPNDLELATVVEKVSETV